MPKRKTPGPTQGMRSEAQGKWPNRSADTGAHSSRRQAAGGGAPSGRRAATPSTARPALEPRLTVADIARRYRVSPWTVRDWLNSGALRGSVADGRWTTTWDAVFAFEGRLAPPQGAARERAKQPLLTVADLAAHFRRTPETIRRRLRRGTLSGRKIQGEWYADRDAVAACELAELDRRLGGTDAA